MTRAHVGRPAAAGRLFAVALLPGGLVLLGAAAVRTVESGGFPLVFHGRSELISRHPVDVEWWRWTVPTWLALLIVAAMALAVITGTVRAWRSGIVMDSRGVHDRRHWRSTTTSLEQIERVGIVLTTEHALDHAASRSYASAIQIHSLGGIRVQTIDFAESAALHVLPVIGSWLAANPTIASNTATRRAITAATELRGDPVRGGGVKIAGSSITAKIALSYLVAALIAAVAGSDGALTRAVFATFTLPLTCVCVLVWRAGIRANVEGLRLVPLYGRRLDIPVGAVIAATCHRNPAAAKEQRELMTLIGPECVPVFRATTTQQSDRLARWLGKTVR